jgi:hypothetical protein
LNSVHHNFTQVLIFWYPALFFYIIFIPFNIPLYLHQYKSTAFWIKNKNQAIYYKFVSKHNQLINNRQTFIYYNTFLLIIN